MNRVQKQRMPDKSTVQNCTYKSNGNNKFVYNFSLYTCYL